MDATLRVEIFPADVNATTAFYELLGFELIDLKLGPPPYASVRLGSVRIGVCQAEPIDPERRAYPAMTELVIEVDDVEAARQRIVDRGVRLTDDLGKREWGLVDFRVTDPDGYYLRFTSRSVDESDDTDGERAGSVRGTSPLRREQNR